MTTIFLATNNRAKYRFMRAYCSLIKCNFETPHDSGLDHSFEENGESIEENAKIKALGWSNYTPHMVLSEDYGFEIPALKGNWRKEWSKRNVGGEQVTDAERRRNLLLLMGDLRGEDRRIYWTSAIALAMGGRLVGVVSSDNPNPSYIVEKIDLDKDIVRALKKRADKNYLSLKEMVEDIIRRSMVSWKGGSIRKRFKSDDKLVSVFSREKRGRKKKR